MSDGKVLLADAQVVALEIREALEGVCLADRCCVVGSVRRRKAVVGDIEILYVSQVGRGAMPGEFFETDDAVLADVAIERLVEAGVLRRRLNVHGQLSSWGALNKHAVHVASGMRVDLFRTSDAAWWNSLVARTGGKDSNVALCQAAKARGWTWNPYGVGYTMGKYANGDPQEARMDSEAQVFEFVGLRYVEPWGRS